MFHVLDHAAVVFSGELSQATRYVIDHYGQQLDEAIRSGIKIAYTESLTRLDGAAQAMRACVVDGTEPC